MAYIDVGKIENIRFMCHKILPLVYDESLSYYETLCKVANKLNETIDATNQLEENVSTLNGSVNTLTGRVNQIAEELNTFEANMTQRFEELEANVNTTVDNKMREVDSKLVEMDNKINQIDNVVTALRVYVEESIEHLTTETQKIIDDAISQMNDNFKRAEDEMRIYVYNQLQTAIRELPEITNIMVNNPVTGKLSTIQNALDSLFENTRYFAITCDEYNSLGLSCTDLLHMKGNYIPRGWTIIEWLTYARRWLKINPEHKAYMPNTGEKVDYHKVIDFNTDMFRQCGALTMDELSEIIMTYDEFVALELTADDIAWRSNRLLA